jgi:hypothetical protein
MHNKREMTLLVGDNPFHGISHLSQERARFRGDVATSAENAAKLVLTAIDNGADGFMFSVSDETLSILRTISKLGESRQLRLYALVPYAYEYVRLAVQLGGLSGLAKKFAKQIIMSGNVRAIAAGLKGLIRADLASLMKTYLIYEVSRVKSSVGKQGILESVLLHEVVTDMALALELDWLFKSYIDFLSKLKIKPGFETRNFAYLVSKFREWNLDLSKVILAAPFNKIGFQMNPSREECEKASASLPKPNVIAMSILAAGYINPLDAISYLDSLPNMKGVVVGVSKENQASSTFKLLSNTFKTHCPQVT